MHQGSNPNNWTRETGQLVGGQFLGCTPQHVKPQWHHHDVSKGAFYSASFKQKLDTKSSTDAELVVINDSMAQVLCTRHFLEAQGMYVPTTAIYQDNKSTILLAENGKTSSSRRTRHLNGQYFFMLDKIKKGEVKVAFCPTHNMLGDFFAIPLQGHYLYKCMKRYLICPAVQAPLFTGVCWINKTMVQRDIMRQNIAKWKNQAMYLWDWGNSYGTWKKVGKWLEFKLKLKLWDSVICTCS